MLTLGSGRWAIAAKMVRCVLYFYLDLPFSKRLIGIHVELSHLKPMKHNIFDSCAGLLQRLIQTRIWGMDIHPSAQIATTALIDRTWPRGIHIGPGCRIADEAVVLTHDFTRGLYLDTIIGARTYLGPRSIIMPGITIGEDCVIMPGALVNKNMPANSVAIGNPARIEARVADA